MSVQLLAIQFNHDSSSATADALNIRRNAAKFVDVPEWKRTVSINPEDSPAAYSISSTQGNTLTIKAKFRRMAPSIASAEIRALDMAVNPPGPSGCIGFLLWLLRAILRVFIGSVLGEVKARSVAFQPNDETNFEPFQLHRLRLWSAGVGARDIQWRWQYRLNPGDPWTDFDTSTHRIYSLLTIPTAPWQQTPHNAGNTQLPWTDVLDYACRWAQGTASLDAAGGRITREVYNLGPSIVTYDCPGGGSSHYSAGNFQCTKFVDRLRGGAGNGIYVNCSDCATFVSTFANAVGCDLWQSRMGWGFQLNEGLSIGSSVWQTACNWGGFNYHEVAWKGACTSAENVFDACLQVDGDADPTTAPHMPLLPVNLQFGNPGDGVYRDRLCTAAGRPNCNPQPGTRARRAVS
jgi:hypothetical protein